MSITDLIDSVRADVDKTLGTLVPGAEVEPRKLHEAIRWSLFAGGKRIRPAIVAAVGEAFGAARPRLLRTAAAIEMVHTYSLIHDDLPSMDDDDLRRGRATCHVQFGEATAILAGDVLQTMAFRAIADDDGLSPEIRVRLISMLASASGTPDGMASGQQLDLDAEGKELSLAAVESIHRQKTGALIVASALSGAVIAGATPPEGEAIRKYAENLGLLFQVTDDLLDVTADTASLGKTAGKDHANAKATYPSMVGIDGTRKLADEMYASACRSLDEIGARSTQLVELAELVLRRSF